MPLSQFNVPNPNSLSKTFSRTIALNSCIWKTHKKDIRKDKVKESKNAKRKVKIIHLIHIESLVEFLMLYCDSIFLWYMLYHKLLMRGIGGFRDRKNPDSKLNITASTAFQNPTPDPLGRVSILMCM